MKDLPVTKYSALGHVVPSVRQAKFVLYSDYEECYMALKEAEEAMERLSKSVKKLKEKAGGGGGKAESESDK